jgi:hypothetical protein
MRTSFWISLFTSYRITENQLIESNVILIPYKEIKKLKKVKECFEISELEKLAK